MEVEKDTEIPEEKKIKSDQLSDIDKCIAIAEEPKQIFVRLIRYSDLIRTDIKYYKLEYDDTRTDKYPGGIARMYPIGKHMSYSLTDGRIGKIFIIEYEITHIKINYYPDQTLIGNVPNDFGESYIRDVHNQLIFVTADDYDKIAKSREPSLENKMITQNEEYRILKKRQWELFYRRQYRKKRGGKKSRKLHKKSILPKRRNKKSRRRIFMNNGVSSNSSLAIG